MKFNSVLQSAKLIKRYKRFMADIITPQKEIITIYCPNTGSMIGCANPNDIIWYSHSPSITRKFPYTWEITVTHKNDWICVNTLRANQLVKEALLANRITKLCGYDTILSEVKYGIENSRIDFLLQKKRKHCYVEVKSVTLLQDGIGYFPDTVTKRGQKHLRELTRIVLSGHRAVLIYLVLHSAITKVLPAYHIDSYYAELYKKAINTGVEVLFYKAELSSREIRFNNMKN